VFTEIYFHYEKKAKLHRPSIQHIYEYLKQHQKVEIVGNALEMSINTMEVYGKLFAEENREALIKRREFKKQMENLSEQEIIEEFLKCSEIETTIQLNEKALENLKSDGIPIGIIDKMKSIKNSEFADEEKLLKTLKTKIGDIQTDRYKSLILEHVIIGVSNIIKTAYENLYDRTRELCEIGGFGEIDEINEGIIQEKMLDELDLYATAVKHDTTLRLLLEFRSNCEEMRDTFKQAFEKYHKISLDVLSLGGLDLDAEARISAYLLSLITRFEYSFNGNSALINVMAPDHSTGRIGNIYENNYIKNLYKKKVKDKPFRNLSTPFAPKEWMVSFLNSLYNFKRIEWEYRKKSFPRSPTQHQRIYSSEGLYSIASIDKLLYSKTL
jgi:hypothetical protein